MKQQLSTRPHPLHNEWSFPPLPPYPRYDLSSLLQPSLNLGSATTFPGSEPILSIKSLLLLLPHINHFSITSSLIPQFLSHSQDFAQVKASYVLSEIFNSSFLPNTKI